MCGIFGYIGKKSNAAKLVLEGLKTLEYRGYDSWGIAVVANHNAPLPPLNPESSSGQALRGGIPPLRLRGDQEGLRSNNRIIIKKRVGKIGDATVDDLPSGTIAFGHTRWATHGGVTQLNAHPHLDCTGSVALIHNGIIENYAEFKKELSKKGHHFISDTDTEVAAHLIEELRKTNKFAEAVRKSFLECTGLNAFIVMDSTSNSLVAVRNGSPLVVGFGEGENFLASDAAALLPYTKKVYFMEDDDLIVLSDSHATLTDVRTNEQRNLKTRTLNWTISQATLGNYPHFMLKEIYEQPRIVAEIAGRAPEAIKLATIIKKAYGTYLVGCGSASYICIAGSYLFSKIARKHVNWAVGSEFGYQLEFLTPQSLVIALSQSGETMDTLEAVKKAKAKGAQSFALVNVLGSTLYRLADHKMPIGAGPEKAVASTKALTGKLAHLVQLAYAAANNVAAGQQILIQAAKSTDTVLSPANIVTIKQLAKKLKHADHVYVIGRGLSYPASLETAIKIKEISYIHAEGMAAGELKHGPLALVEKGTPCIAFLPDDETYGANLAGTMEMKARGGYIIGISYKPHEVFDYYLHVDDANEATIIPNIVVGQLLAYYLSVEKGLDPDKPRNLAKSVTVK